MVAEFHGLPGSDWEEKEVNHTWFHIVRDQVQSGTIAKVGLAPWAVYCAIKSHTGLATGNAFPSTARLAELVGVSQDTVFRALKVLVTHGLLNADKKTGKGSKYSVTEKIAINHQNGLPWAVGEKKYVPVEFSQFVAQLQRLAETGQGRLDGLAAVGKPVKKTREVIVLDAGDPGRVRLRFEIAPLDQLRQR